MNGTFEAYKTVAFDIIREQLADLANSAEAREMARGLVPCMEEGELRRSMRDTTQARQMLELAGTPPMPAMEHTAEFVARSVRGELLTPEEMEEIGMFLAAVRRVRSYLDKGMSYGIPLSCYGENLRLMTELKEEIEGAIRHGRVDDRASNTLRDIRRDLQLLEEKIKDKAEALLKSQKKFMAESFLVTRNGRLCLPVKKEYKSKIPGSTIDRSSSGSTVFIEPETIARMQDEIEGLRRTARRGVSCTRLWTGLPWRRTDLRRTWLCWQNWILCLPRESSARRWTPGNRPSIPRASYA